jgi:hypothetical protein
VTGTWQGTGARGGNAPALPSRNQPGGRQTDARAKRGKTKRRESSGSERERREESSGQRERIGPPSPRVMMHLSSLTCFTHATLALVTVITMAK